MSEQNEHGLSEDAVQTPQKETKKPKEKRSQADKVGVLKYIAQKLNRMSAIMERMETQQRWERLLLERQGLAVYTRKEVEGWSEQDEVDKEIIQRLFEVGVNGALPKDVAAEVNKRTGYTLKYYEVSRRLLRLNKKLHHQTGKILFEKHGHRWAMTSFGFETYGGSNDSVDLQQERSATALIPGDREIKEEESSAW